MQVPQGIFILRVRVAPVVRAKIYGQTNSISSKSDFTLMTRFLRTRRSTKGECMTNTSTPIEHFKKEAKKLFRRVEAGEAEALDRVRRVLKDSEDVSLMRVQHVIAVEAGYLKWENLIDATAVELQAAISKKIELPSDLRVKLRVPPPGETPLVSYMRGLFEGRTPPQYKAFADLMDTMTMEEQRRWLDEDARKMGLFDR